MIRINLTGHLKSKILQIQKEIKRYKKRMTIFLINSFFLIINRNQSKL
jgi:hypothetical protein